MTSKRVLRYYCDHCRKGGCSKSSMVKHEERCTLNPERKCGFCALAGYEQQPMASLLAILDEDGDIDKLRESVNNCPGCIMAAIRISIVKGDFDEDWIEYCYKTFDFKKDVAEFWAEHNSNKAEAAEARLDHERHDVYMAGFYGD